METGLRTFDVDMKRAQLENLRVPCSALLVDECQDLDACQVGWIEDQRRFGTHVFLVGDAAQCIYGFRRAKAQNVMELECVDAALTRSWRFGPNLARIANVALFAKERSPQTNASADGRTPRLWRPYRVEGARGVDVAGGGEGGGETDGVPGGRATTTPLLEEWRKYRPLALIGRTNAGLMVKAMDLIGLAGLRDISAEDAGGEGEAVDMAGDLPRFHINGKGDSLGKARWTKASSQIEHL